MQFKIKYLKISTLTIATICLMACGGSEKPAETAADTSAIAATHTNPPASTVDEMVDFKFHYLIGNIPSPMELVDALPSAGFTFSKDLLNNIDNEKKYMTSFKKAVNFGVYSVDMAYITSNEEFTLVKSYMATAQSLAKSLELSETFNKVVGDRLKNNAENKDSLKKVIDDAYYEIDNYMRNNERALTATQMLTGSWLESQYITLALIKDVPVNDQNKILFEKIFEQKRHLESLVSLLKEYEKEKEFAPVIAQLNKLNIVYKNMKTAEVGNKEFMNKLYNSVAEIRKAIIS
jgi:hypothetical protein